MLLVHLSHCWEVIISEIIGGIAITNLTSCISLTATVADPSHRRGGWRRVMQGRRCSRWKLQEEDNAELGEGSVGTSVRQLMEEKCWKENEGGWVAASKMNVVHKVRRRTSGPTKLNVGRKSRRHSNRGCCTEYRIKDKRTLKQQSYRKLQRSQFTRTQNRFTRWLMAFYYHHALILQGWKLEGRSPKTWEDRR
jgi:hypothetical protein